MIIATFIAALTLGAATVPAVADAAPGQTTVSRRTVTTRTDRRYDGPRWRYKTVCKVRNRGNRRVRTCNRVRVRY
ncbi:hypothetical protein [uncultured Sphingomonas sp.]|uniref:hypothetical protein n=1 Tax=uncultured Sphingomonas sp. TaxID=158754 RepID=UPI0035CC4F2D